jgi:hypothetical protein
MQPVQTFPLGTNGSTKSAILPLVKLLWLTTAVVPKRHFPINEIVLNRRHGFTELPVKQTWKLDKNPKKFLSSGKTMPQREPKQ